MKELTTTTEQYNGKRLTLTIAQWSELLKVPKKTLYGRRKRGKKGEEFTKGKQKTSAVQGNKEEREKYITKCYRAFNFSHGIVNCWRQKNGIR